MSRLRRMASRDVSIPTTSELASTSMRHNGERAADPDPHAQRADMSGDRKGATLGPELIISIVQSTCFLPSLSEHAREPQVKCS